MGQWGSMRYTLDILDYNKLKHVCIEASRGARAVCDCKRDWFWVRSSFGEMNCYLFIFSCLCSGEAKRVVKLRHLTSNAFKIWREMGNRVF